MVKAALAKPCHGAAEASGYIRVQDGLFVDEECKEFMFSGYNAWEVGIFCLPGVFSRHCAPLSGQTAAFYQCRCVYQPAGLMCRP